MMELRIGDYLNNSRSVIKMVSQLSLGIIEAGTVNLKEVCTRFRSGTQKTNYRAVQRFFQHKSLHNQDVIRYIIDNLFEKDEKITLAIDRTDWSFGQTRHNLLVVSVLYGKTAVPLIILSLESKGNSNCDQRTVLLDKILSVIPRHRIKAIIGDREFMGETWFKLLKQRHLPFVMRIRGNITVAKGSFVGSVSNFPTSKQPKNHGKVQIGSRLLELSTTYSNGDLVAVISNNVSNPLKLYKQRWSIETGFKCLKSNGFNLEDTHLKHPERIKMLVQICAIAMTILFKSVKNEIFDPTKKNMVILKSHSLPSLEDI